MKNRIFWALAALAVLGLVVYWRLSGTKAPPAPAAPPSVLVKTVTLRPGTLPQTVLAYGNITAGPGGATQISAQGSGVIAELPAVAGEAVAAGAQLVTIAPDAQSAAELAKAENAVTAAKANRAHVAALLASHLATTADLAAADQTLGDAKAGLRALRAAGVGQKMTITAPFAGVVAALPAALGELVTPGTQLLQLDNTADLAATAGLPPASLGSLKLGDPAVITLLGTGATIRGKIEEIAAMPDAQTGLGSVMLALGGAAELGAPVRAVITAGTLHGFVLPRDAVQNDTQGDYVFQVDAQKVAHRENVQVLGNSGDETIIAPTLNTAMPVVTAGAYQLSDGMDVRYAAPGAGH